ncbi:glycosyl hydrolase family 28-related protein [Krasilnikovia sp. MM14-A1259]|uniref:glycosyl hydrolase family 28-related protein n=1 Tax=Krasilnikovia sp. MM14-A1259 TaxID=3373539 RepID=UPI0037FABE96
MTLLTTAIDAGRRWWDRRRRPTGAVPASPSRRAMLTGGGALLLGAGVTGATTGYYAGTGSPPTGEATSDVRKLGATGDGRTDDTEALQRAIDAVKDTGGVVYLPPGVYLTRGLRLYSRVHLRGAGGDTTTLKLHKGANKAILESDRFSELTGTDKNAGIGHFSVRDLTLDGNKDENPDGGYGIRVYGYGYELSEVIIFNCRQDGLYSEWSASAALPSPSHQMEARLTAVRSHDNEGDGLNFNGPHDSMFVNCVSFENSGVGFRMAGQSHGSQMINCHGWGIRQAVAFHLAALSIGCVNCYADINGGVGVRIFRHGCRWVGGFVLGANHTGHRREIGVQFVPGPAANEPSGCVIDTKISNCATAAIDFGADSGQSSIRAQLTQPGVHINGRYVDGSGAGWIGSPHPTSRVDVVEGVADAGKNYVVSPAFELRSQDVPGAPGPDSVRVFARTVGGNTQLCAQFPNGVVRVLAAE